MPPAWSDRPGDAGAEAGRVRRRVACWFGANVVVMILAQESQHPKMDKSKSGASLQRRFANLFDSQIVACWHRYYYLISACDTITTYCYPTIGAATRDAKTGQGHTYPKKIIAQLQSGATKLVQGVDCRRAATIRPQGSRSTVSIVTPALCPPVSCRTRQLPRMVRRSVWQLPKPIGCSA